MHCHLLMSQFLFNLKMPLSFHFPCNLFFKKSLGLFVCPVEFLDLPISTLWGSLAHGSILCISYNLIAICGWWMESGLILFPLIYQLSKIMNWFFSKLTNEVFFPMSLWTWDFKYIWYSSDPIFAWAGRGLFELSHRLGRYDSNRL